MTGTGATATGAAGTATIAALPMYDWPEARPATDRFWRRLREALRARGIAAPERLARDLPAEAAWTDAGLVIGQTCGLPYVRGLAGRVTLLGAAEHGIEGCSPGQSRSALVVRARDRRAALADFAGARPAVNCRASQSGHAALLHHAAPHARARRFFAAPRITGSHSASAAAVAAGTADIAAIDCVSWHLIVRHRPAARRLRVLMLTDPAPALPYIAARGRDPEPLRAALAEAIGRLDTADREALLLRGFRPFEPADYAVIRRRAEAAAARLVM